MTDEQIALARRFVAAPRWRWRAGMADLFGRRVMQVYPDELGVKWSHLLENRIVRDADAVPDLSDAATLGCILALYEETRTTLSCPDPVYTYASAYGLFHPKTLEALVHALEAP